MNRLAIALAVALVAFLALSGGVSIADEAATRGEWAAADLEGFVQVQPGVYEKLGPEGQIIRRGEGLDGVRYLLNRTGAQIEAMIASGEAVSQKDRYKALLKKQAHWESVLADLVLSEATSREKEMNCTCYSVVHYARVDDSPYGGPFYYIAKSKGNACLGGSYTGYVVSIAVDAESTKTIDCDDASGAAIDIVAAEGDGFDYRCVYGFAELYGYYTGQNCSNQHYWAEEVDGDYPEECTDTCS